MKPEKRVKNVLRIYKRSSGSVPIVYDSPHSGIIHPPDFKTTATKPQLKTARDAFVDELILESSNLGVAVLLADFPRTYIDPNRSTAEIDTSMVQGKWAREVQITRKLDVGMGLIRKFILPNVPMYLEKLSVAEVENRIKKYWSPYHRALKMLLDEKVAEFDAVFYIDWHSMKSKGNQMNIDSGRERPDFVVSDQDGKTSSRKFRDVIVKNLKSQGYEVAVNYPYKGAELIKRHGVPTENRHAVQIEINRRLYMDESSFLKNNSFPVLKDNILKLTERLVYFTKAEKYYY
tara:strand:- start:209 stop:1078 length:870 start_codon:yes stop_codon:yes gene_type:complete